MSIKIWIFYVLTVLALMRTPGSSQLLMLSHSAMHGFRSSLATACGDLSANVLQMSAVVLGLGVFIISPDATLTFIKWAGVLYLLVHAIRIIKNAKPAELACKEKKAKISIKTLYMQGFITSASNPKAVLFFAALFPQFMAYDGNFRLQFLILSSTYLIIDGIFLSLYGIGAQWIVSIISPKSTIRLTYLSGTLMIVAAALLGFKSLDAVAK